MTEEQALPTDQQAAIDARNAAARESIAQAQAMWQRRQASLKPLPRVGALEALHAGLRERVATSIFGREIRQDDYCNDTVTYMQSGVSVSGGKRGSAYRDYGPYVCLPSTHGIQPLSDIVLAALITFLRRGQRAHAGTLVSDGKTLEASNDPV